MLARYPEAQIAASYHRGEALSSMSASPGRRSTSAILLPSTTGRAISNALTGSSTRPDTCTAVTAGRKKAYRALDPEFLLENIRINTLPTLMLAKSFSAALKQSPAPLLATVSARVGSIEDNRLGGWYSYRVSKAALNMALKTLSIEWKHSHPRGCVAALHPGTNDTALSKPFQANVAADDLFDPTYTASMFADLLARLGPADSGKFWAWNGETLPW